MGYRLVLHLSIVSEWLFHSFGVVCGPAAVLYLAAIRNIACRARVLSVQYTPDGVLQYFLYL